MVQKPKQIKKKKKKKRKMTLQGLFVCAGDSQRPRKKRKRMKKTWAEGYWRSWAAKKEKTYGFF